MREEGDESPICAFKKPSKLPKTQQRKSSKQYSANMSESDLASKKNAESAANRKSSIPSTFGKVLTKSHKAHSFSVCDKQMSNMKADQLSSISS